MYSYKEVENELLRAQKTWLITGVAGFIGSNLLEKLLLLNQKVIGIDNFFTGNKKNLEDVKHNVTSEQWNNFIFNDLDITNKQHCSKIFASNTIDNVLHHAAISSVQFSMKNPDLINKTNVEGFSNIIDLVKDNDIKSFIYASSSSVYGDNSDKIKQENNIGNLLSPYASSKYSNELTANKYNKIYNLNAVGFRYFNVFGKRQDPNGSYAAVIPKWICSVLNNEPIYINGDGSTTRDFCYIDEIIKANLLASLNHSDQNNYNVFNIGIGESISLSYLYNIIIKLAHKHGMKYNLKPVYRDFIDGDIIHSCANIRLAINNLNFHPEYSLESGIEQVFSWYLHNH